MAKREKQPAPLKGWKQIAGFLGQPVATAQRWAKTGMPVRREGRYMVASPDELSRWLGREAGVGQAVRIATDNADLSTDLRRALADARYHRRRNPPIQHVSVSPASNRPQKKQ